MSDRGTIENKFSELLREIRKAIKKRLSRHIGDIRIIKLDQKFRVVVLVVSGCLAVGFFIGFVATKGTTGGDGFSFSQLLPLEQKSFPGTQLDGSFIFSNFEDERDVADWSRVSSSMRLSTHYAWEGAWSAQLTFHAGEELSAVTVDDLGRSESQPSDWSEYESLQFYVFQPGGQSEQITLLITDLWGKKYQEDLTVPHSRWAKFTIPIDKIAYDVNIKKVNQFSLSRRQKGVAVDFYLDDVRLIPSLTKGRYSSEKIMNYGFPARKAAWTFFDPRVNGEVVRVPFMVKNEANAFCHLCPVEGGMPIPMGELYDEHTVRLRNEFGEDLPFQPRVLAYWPDRSIKWLGVTFAATLNAQAGSGFSIEYGSNVHNQRFASPLAVKDTASQIQVDTGPLRAVLDKRSFYLFKEVWLDQNQNGDFEAGELVTKDAELTLSFQGKPFRAHWDQSTYEIEVEETGLERVVVKASSWLQSADGERFCQAIVRYYFHRDKSEVRIAHTLVYTGYPENREYSAYQMLNLPDNEPIDSYGLEIPIQTPKDQFGRAYVGLAHTAPLGIVPGGRLKASHLTYDAAGVERDGENVPVNDALAGWLDVASASGGVGVAIRNFRENFPKAITANQQANRLEISLWPKDAGPLDFRTTELSSGVDAFGRGQAFGVAKTHDLLLYFHGGQETQDQIAAKLGSFMKPVIVRPNPYWVDATGALGRLFPVDRKYVTVEKMLERLFDWAARHPKAFKWYGMLNFGDVLTWWRDQDDSGVYPRAGWHPNGRWGWYNCEGVGLHTGALLQFARSGKWKYFEFGENMARHLMDVDTVHYNTVAGDKRLSGVLDERYSQIGAMHRHNADHWGGRTDEASHTHVWGLLLYYYLSGNERALDVAKEIGEYYLSEPFSYIERPDVVPNRSMANALWGDVLLYQATWDSRYKEAADKLVKIFHEGQQNDGSFLENYNPILKTWSGSKHDWFMNGYIVGALMSYHELTQEETVQQMFLRLVRYLAPREFSGPSILHGIGYAYLITHDPFFIYMAEENLDRLLKRQQVSNDPLYDGLVYEKPIYHRPMTFLSTVPYVIGALEERFVEQGE